MFYISAEYLIDGAMFTFAQMALFTVLFTFIKKGAGQKTKQITSKRPIAPSKPTVLSKTLVQHL